MNKTGLFRNSTVNIVAIFFVAVFSSFSSYAQTAIVLPNSEAANAPAMTKHNGKMYIAYPQYSTNKIVVRSLDGSYFRTLSDKTSDTPAIASLDGKLHLAYKSNSGERIYNKTMTGTSWGSTSGNPSTTRKGPALEAFNGLLYMMFNSKSNDDLLYKWNNSGSWISAKNSGSDLFDSPSMAVHNGVMYVAYRSDDKQDEISVRPYYGSSWGSSVRLYGTKTADKPVLASSGSGLLFLVYKARDSDRIYYKTSFDGTVWSAQVDTGLFSAGTPGAEVSLGFALTLAGKESYDDSFYKSIWTRTFYEY